MDEKRNETLTHRAERMLDLSRLGFSHVSPVCWISLLGDVWRELRDGSLVFEVVRVLSMPNYDAQFVCCAKILTSGPISVHVTENLVNYLIAIFSRDGPASQISGYPPIAASVEV